MAKAVSYLRVSGIGQVKGDGFPRQREAIREFAKAAGLELVGEYRDGGVSGTHELENRIGLSELLERVAGNGVSAVVVENSSRLARDLLVSEAIIAQFRREGVAVFDASTGQDLTAADDDPTRKFIRQVLGAVAEFEKAMLVAKLKTARERRRKETGRCEGPKPFGELPGEDETLARMRKLRRKPRGGTRRSYAEIARILNEEQRPPRKAAEWSRGTVAAILG